MTDHELPPADDDAHVAVSEPGPRLHVVPAGNIDELGSRIVGLSGRLAAATCRWLLLVAEFDAQSGCDHYGLISTARWLSHYCGLSARTAIEHVRVARALRSFPALADAMTASRLSYSQARAISRLAHIGEHRLVSDLIDVASTGTVGQLEVMVRGLRTVEHNAAGAPAVPEYVTRTWGDDSRWRLNARLAPERGAVIQTAMERLARAENIDPVQALERMAEITLAVLDDARTTPVRPLRGHERAAVVIHIDEKRIPKRAPIARAPRSAERSQGPSASASGPAWARIESGPGLPDPVVLRLLCDGRIRTAVRDGTGDVLNLGRTRRLVTDRQFQALLLRDGGCAFPGCGSSAGLEAHHVRHWIHGGRTNMANLILLCRAHHHIHHDGEFTVHPARGPGRFEFRRADGHSLPLHVNVADHITASTPLESEHCGVDPVAATTDSTGQRLDRAWAISVLAHRRAS